MPIDKATAISQMDAVFARRKELESVWYPDNVQEITTLTCAVIKRFALPGSAYHDQMEAVFENTVRSVIRSKEDEIESRLQGVLRALRADYDAGRLQTFQELVHAEMFSDFLEMAEYLLQEGYKDAAAVMAGGVIEGHLRKLCGKHGVMISTKPKLDAMNADLARVNAYGRNDQKQVTAWAGLRNDAAHGCYDNYTDAEVKLMVAGAREFLSRNPA